jgi:hypothetical protein
MPMPEGSQLNQSVSPMLTNMAQSFIPDPSQFAARDIFPNVPVASATGVYNIWKQGDFFRRTMKKLGNAEGAPRGGFSTGSGTYNVAMYGLGTTYTARDLANARRGGSSDQQLISAKVKYVTFQAYLELELQTASLVQTSGNWTLSVAGTASGPTAGTSFIYWDSASSTPVDDVIYLKNRMRLMTGFMPNKMVIPYQVWLKLRANIQLLSRITYGGTMDRPTQITLNQLKALFEIDDIVVPMGVYNTAAEGQADALTDIWGKYVWLGHVTSAPSIEEPSAGYLFSWVGDTTVGLPQGVSAGMGPNTFGSVRSDNGLFIREYLENHPSQMVVESELWTTPNVTAADLGILMTGVIA